MAAKEILNTFARWHNIHAVERRLLQIEEALGIADHALGHHTTAEQVSKILHVVEEKAAPGIIPRSPIEIDLSLPNE
jgi:hypothetical protein